MEKLIYKWSINPSEEYYELRSNIYSHDLNIQIPYTDQFDALSEHLIVREAKKIVGGARLTISKNCKIPLEHETCLLNNIFTKEHLEEYGYGEVTRLFLEHKYRNRRIVRGIYALMNKKRKEYGVHYLFSFQPKTQARLTAMICNHLGYHARIVKVEKLNCESLYHHLGDIYIIAITHLRDPRWVKP